MIELKPYSFFFKPSKTRTTTDIQTLPTDILMQIFEWLSDVKDKRKFGETCKKILSVYRQYYLYTPYNQAFQVSKFINQEINQLEEKLDKIKREYASIFNSKGRNPDRIREDKKDSIKFAIFIGFLSATVLTLAKWQEINIQKLPKIALIAVTLAIIFYALNMIVENIRDKTSGIIALNLKHNPLERENQNYVKKLVKKYGIFAENAFLQNKFPENTLKLETLIEMFAFMDYTLKNSREANQLFEVFKIELLGLCANISTLSNYDEIQDNLLEAMLTLLSDTSYPLLQLSDEDIEALKKLIGPIDLYCQKIKKTEDEIKNPHLRYLAFMPTEISAIKNKLDESLDNKAKALEAKIESRLKFEDCMKKYIKFYISQYKKSFSHHPKAPDFISIKMNKEN